MEFTWMWIEPLGHLKRLSRYWAQQNRFWAEQKLSNAIHKKAKAYHVAKFSVAPTSELM